jgi:hypothetical protein
MAEDQSFLDQLRRMKTGQGSQDVVGPLRDPRELALNRNLRARAFAPRNLRASRRGIRG